MSNLLTPEGLNQKVSQVFGRLAIDKRRLPGSQLNRRNVPAYVAEWILDSLVPGDSRRIEQNPGVVRSLYSST
jgi:predicted ATP-dependent Lon-type protease